MKPDLIEVTEGNQLVKKLLVGDRLAGFETGDAWTLRLLDKDLFIAFQSMSSPQTPLINQALRKVDETLFAPADKEYVGWATILAFVIRKTIIAASVDSDAALTLVFEGGYEITIRTDADVVDWQWCITKDPRGNPYTTQVELACLWKSEISSWVRN